LALESGLLRHLIADTYTRERLSEIKQALAEHRSHQISPVANGLFAASSSQAAASLTGYQNVWVRDNIMVADCFRRRDQLAPAIACVQGLTRFFATQLVRFREIISDPTRALHKDANRRPHIRLTAQNLAELPEKWTHAQNDALGEALWFRFQLANSNVLPMTDADYQIYRNFPAYFAAIEYWHDPDSGAWEEGRKVNSSSVGAVLAGLEEMRRYHSSKKASAADAEQLTQLIAKGRQRLDSTLPFESPPERLVDSALLFLIHPLGLVQTREMEDAILNLVQARLKGEVGIKRYAGDSYFCQDYDEWFPAGQMSSAFSDKLEFRDAHLQPNCEAQWCLFDPLLSIIYGRRFLADRSDRASLQKQIHYFNRSLSQVTATGECPELYFLKHGSYIPNIHTPLAWTQANQAVALYLMEKSIGEP
jgi:GH15 family glucan-1,4-alpha-glucosidase